VVTDPRAIRRIYDAYAEAATLVLDAGQVAKDKGVHSIEFADADRKAGDAIKNCRKVKERFGILG
jgi:hypothetical protein